MSMFDKENFLQWVVLPVFILVMSVMIFLFADMVRYDVMRNSIREMQQELGEPVMNYRVAGSLTQEQVRVERDRLIGKLTKKLNQERAEKSIEPIILKVEKE